MQFEFIKMKIITIISSNGSLTERSYLFLEACSCSETVMLVSGRLPFRPLPVCTTSNQGSTYTVHRLSVQRDLSTIVQRGKLLCYLNQMLCEISCCVKYHLGKCV